MNAAIIAKIVTELKIDTKLHWKRQKEMSFWSYISLQSYILTMCDILYATQIFQLHIQFISAITLAERWA